MTIKELVDAIFDETNLKQVEIEVFNCANVLEKTLLEDQDQDKKQNLRPRQKKT